MILALAAGVGFGIGEIWFLAHALIRSPGYPDLPFWMFGGFVVERLEVCFLHGALLIPPFYALATGRSGGVRVRRGGSANSSTRPTRNAARITSASTSRSAASAAGANRSANRHASGY